MQAIYHYAIVEAVTHSHCPIILVFFRLDMVKTPGKGGRLVPILLTPEVKKAIEILLETRELVSIHHDNPFIFALREPSLKHHRLGCTSHSCCQCRSSATRSDHRHKTKEICCHSEPNYWYEWERTGMACFSHGTFN